jgi:hypothetical protein
MGIEEYEFLTKTMEHIESESISLAKTKNRLKKLDEEISKMEDKSSRNWDKFNSFKEELEKQKENLPEPEIKDESSELQLPKSTWRTEVRTLKESRRKKLDFLAAPIIRWFVPWLGTFSEKFFSVSGPALNADLKENQLKWATDENYDRKEVLESWDFGSILIPWYLFFWMPAALVAGLLAASYVALYDEGNYLSFCYDEDGNISSEEEVYFSEVNDGEVDCTYGGDERALNASEEQQLQEIENRDFSVMYGSIGMMCFGPILFIVLSTIYLRPKLEEVVELDSQINVILSKLSGTNRRERRRKKYESDLNSVPKKEAENAAHDQSLATERRKRDSMRVDMEDLEAKIQRLWESINHLIPYSSELDKN